MTPRAYYNEIDPFAADWIRSLMKAGLIMDGVVDDRSITEVTPEDLDGFTQVHFFAGVAGWSYALQLAAWPEDRPVFTGSCPCQPFSNAGRRKGTEDERHLWPEMSRLIKACKPPTVFGEQVASKAGREWFDGVSADLEALDYSTGAADLCSASVNAPHIRQRLYWLADSSSQPSERKPGRLHSTQEGVHGEGESIHGADNLRSPDGSEVRQGMADSPGQQRNQGLQQVPAEAPERSGSHRIDSAGLGDSLGQGLEEYGRPDQLHHQCEGREGQERHAGHPGFHVWDDADLVRCVEPTKEPGRFVEKWRRIEPSTFPLAHGIPQRVGRLRAYGNAITPQVAARFIQAYMDI